VKFGPVPVEEAVGKILAHKLVDDDGRKIFNKGHRLTQADIHILRELHLDRVVVADLAATDLHENDAARRVGCAIAGTNVKVTAPGAGRANLTAKVAGPLSINVPLLDQLNNIDPGITIATLHEHTLVQPRQLVALVKIVPFGIPAARVVDAEALTKEHGPVIHVRPLKPRSVGLIISGTRSTRDKLLNEFAPPTKMRLTKLGSTLDEMRYVEHRSDVIAETLCQMADNGRELILVAGISAIIDYEDVVPTALQLAGGSVTHFGVPVDPGTLLMLGYIGDVPVIGAPGCIKSPKTNVIDWILPRLLAGERLTRADLVKMGHGGLLEDISTRPMPRTLTD